MYRGCPSWFVNDSYSAIMFYVNVLEQIFYGVSVNNHGQIPD